MKYSDALGLARDMRINPTRAEYILWQNIRKRQILGFKFNRQYIICHSEIGKDAYYFIVDFYCHLRGLIIEVDGDIHLDQVERDEMRPSILESMGYRVIRFTNSQVFNSWQSVKRDLEQVLVKKRL